MEETSVEGSGVVSGAPASGVWPIFGRKMKAITFFKIDDAVT
eukprot:CAMPEP_0198216348 /NCGR_PEP_ID=MMETSP1445-20131203/56822_1 /TAXON_ID=36898 /ORGANISM="Pyramimonas sp., Strain CCMP2087" /LENGTH=41 /DNA_ID= /DNA_START= /DNA_END= /DNA_ORIENTATION=